MKTISELLEAKKPKRDLWERGVPEVIATPPRPHHMLFNDPTQQERDDVRMILDAILDGRVGGDLPDTVTFATGGHEPGDDRVYRIDKRGNGNIIIERVR